MKRIILIILILALAGLIVYRFIDQRKVAAIETIAMIQAKEGYPVETVVATQDKFNMTRRYTGTVVGAEETAVISMIGEYIDEVLVRQGDVVKQDQPLFRLSKNNPTARYHSAKLALDNAEIELKRIQTLFDQGAVSKQAVDGMTLQRDLARDGLRISESLLEIRAPLDGVIGELTGEVGQFASPGFPLAKIVSVAKPRVRIHIPAGDRELVKVGTVCNLRTNGTVIKGRIERIALSAEQKDRSFQAWITLDGNPNSKAFSPGLLIDVEVNVLSVDQAVLVPPSALIRTGDHWKLFTIEGGKAVVKAIEVGGKNGSFAYIRAGISAGEEVVVSGANLLFDKAPVRIINRSK